MYGIYTCLATTKLNKFLLGYILRLSVHYVRKEIINLQAYSLYVKRE
jgi:hypothetical protein